MLNKKCIVLGGNGFIGVNILRHLINCNYEVSSFDLYLPKNPIEGVTYMSGDFTNDMELLEAIHGQDIILHLISTTNPGKSMIDPYSGYNIDIIQTIKVLESIKETNAQILFASSGGTVYGEPESCPIKEDSKLNPISHYGITKVTIEHIINMYNSVYGMKNIIMRISNPYGPGQDYTRGVGLIDALVKKGLNDEVVTIWGDGNNIRDYIYIDDLCNAIELLCKYDGNHSVFNIGSGCGHSINNMIEIIKGILDKNINVEYESKRKNDIEHIFLDNKKLKEEVGFIPKISIDEGIKRYIRHLQRITK
ncbi:NAD-dependent epimerase/dehydratase family protein [Clostridium beijerinckii]|uniref:NAD-dependent epimerase/dehydratase family protein n=1 Tax=Clostridium beijerinckii TaxID=1520 RepID=A0A7X9XNH8_CLOBE|nr:NAD-dependent epimerase/dehydratase family protein [Clostridium beijerinckii]NMF04279.1 NAD-dependent epimerase/dehydratase family protein [Clostridium beijerinckii]